MKTVLVVPRDPPGLNNFHQVPIGSLYTAQQLRTHGHDVEFYDLRLREPAENELYAQIARADLAVVFSTDYDLAQCYPSLSPTAACVRQIKSAGAALIACAGSHGTANSGLTQSFTEADLVISGEIEFAVPDLVRILAAGGGYPSRWPVEGVRMADETELSSLGTPAYDLAPMSRYFSEGFVGDELDRVNSGLVLGNRGCPYACSFCYLFFGRRLRRRPVEATLSELRTMHQDYGIKHYFFLDYTFTIDNVWVRELCDGIERLGVEISWLCQTRVDCLDEETLKAMKRAGCSGVWLGIESPELEQRRYLSKGRIGFEDIEKGISLIRRCGLNVLTFVMVGLPNESELSLANLNAWLDTSQVYYSLSTFQRRLGTPLAKDWGGTAVEEHGWGYLDHEDQYLGESSLRHADLGWFFEYHQRSETRVANIMRRRLAAAV